MTKKQEIEATIRLIIQSPIMKLKEKLDLAEKFREDYINACMEEEDEISN